MTEGLVRVVAKDGSVWWTLPVHTASHAALPTQYAAYDFDDGGYNRLYWGSRT